MQHWNTDVIRNILENALGDTYKFGTFGGGGDYDTTEIYLESLDHDEDDECLCGVQGWLVNGGSFEDPGTNRDDNDVDLIAVNIGRYGLEGASPEQLMAVAQVAKVLDKFGYKITTDGWKSWF
jgi:hypothetical protein